MKFFIDANLPFKLVKYLNDKSLEAIHTDHLPRKERTTDSEIREFTKKNDLILISKDSDFLDSHFINAMPKQLLLISTGNIPNKSLFILFDKYFDEIISLFKYSNLIELTINELIVYDK